MLPENTPELGGIMVGRLVIATSATVVAAVLTLAAPAEAATTAATGIPVTFAHSGKCMNVQGASKANGAKVVQYTCSASATNDKWVLVSRRPNILSGTYGYWIRSVGSGKCLTVLNASKLSSAALIQYTCNDGANERWNVESPVGQTTVRLQSVGSGLCVNVPKAVTTSNVQLIQYTCAAEPGSLNERELLAPATSATVVHTPFNSGPQPVAALQGGHYAGHTAPIWYSWIDVDNAWNQTIDYNPDPFGPGTPGVDPTGFTVGGKGLGYNGHPSMALLNDQRVQTVAHSAGDGDVQYGDELGAGSGETYYDWDHDLGGSAAADPIVAPLTTGRLALYEIVQGALWYAPEATGNPQPAVGTWRSLGGTGLTGRTAVLASGSGALVFARTTAGHLASASLTGSTLSAWTDLGGTGLGDPDAVTTSDGRVIVLARGSDGLVHFKKRSATGTWPAAWSTIAGHTAAGNPSAVSSGADGRFVVAIRDTDNLIYVTQETAKSSATFGAWTAVSDPADSKEVALSDPTAVAYTVPTGPSFGVIFQNATTVTDGPYGIFFPSGWTTGQTGWVGKPLPKWSGTDENR